jgi:Gas vesicle synthesis protein GvpL/GvpF
VNPVDAEKPTYVYGLIKADTEIPDGLTGLGPSGRVSTIAHGRVAALVSDVPIDRPLGVRGDLVAHETVLDTVAARDAVVPMRFPAVVEEHAVVDELLAPNEDHFVALLEDLEGRAQFTLTGRYEQDAVLREVLQGDEEIRALREKVRELPEDASYYDRVRLGELIVRALEQRREVDGGHIVEKIEPFAVASVSNQLAAPEDVVNVAFLVERERQEEFENAVEGVGEELAGRVRLRLLGPVAAYDFIPEE